jgi:hypothetical protein
MYVNANMISVPGVRGGKIGERSGGGENSSTIYFIHYKNLCKCYNVPTIVKILKL